jgi:hypothetical protein
MFYSTSIYNGDKVMKRIKAGRKEVRDEDKKNHRVSAQM